MKWLLYGAFLLLVTLFSLTMLTPLGFILDKSRQALPALTYSNASGTIWNADVQGLRYGLQPIGSLRITADASGLPGGQYKANIRVYDGAVTATGKLAAGLGADLSMSDISVRGQTGQLMSLRPEIRDLNGEFTLSNGNVLLRDGRCNSASGRVWTDILTRLEPRYGWAGPELAGPIGCENGMMTLRLEGESPNGERVLMSARIALNATGTFRAEISGAQPETARAATLLGFVTLGDLLVYDYRIDR